MSVTDIRTTSELTLARELRAVMRGRVVLRGDDDYVQTRQIWNGAVQHRPALFAVCETSADVQAAVLVARRHGLPLSVRAGGHDWAGRALCPDGLVIDLSCMTHVVVDPHSRGYQKLLVHGGPKSAAVRLQGEFRSWLLRVLIDEALAILHEKRGSARGAARLPRDRDGARNQLHEKQLCC